MSVPIRPLTESFAVAPQLGPDDMAGVAEAGYKSVIINRPDFEGGPDQPQAADVAKAAAAAGLAVEYQRGWQRHDGRRCGPFRRIVEHTAGARAGLLPYRHALHQPFRRRTAAGLRVINPAGIFLRAAWVFR